jgi:hypothetical protein
MERKSQPPAKSPRPAAPSRPQGGAGRSGRGSASALEAWKKAEQFRLPRREPELPSR